MGWYFTTIKLDLQAGGETRVRKRKGMQMLTLADNAE
jgi:hypothetical protein